VRASEPVNGHLACDHAATRLQLGLEPAYALLGGRLAGARRRRKLQHVVSERIAALDLAIGRAGDHDRCRRGLEDLLQGALARGELAPATLVHDDDQTELERDVEQRTDDAPGDVRSERGQAEGEPSAPAHEGDGREGMSGQPRRPVRAPQAGAVEQEHRRDERV